MNKHISFVIKTIRKANNLTQEDLAAIIGVSPGHIGSLEQGKANPSYEVIEKFIEEFEVDANLFFGRIQNNAKSLNANSLQLVLNMLNGVTEQIITYGRDVEQGLLEINEEDTDKSYDVREG